MGAPAPASDPDKLRQDQEIAALFGAVRPDGTPRFSDDEVNHFLPLAVLSIGQETKGFPRLEALMRTFVVGLNLPPETNAEQFLYAVKRFYAKHPPNRELEHAFFAYCRSQAKGELDADKVRAYAKTAGLKLADASPIRGMAVPTGGMSLRRR